MDFFSALALQPPTVQLILTGELDAFAANQLRERLDEAISRGGVTFEVDASAVTFLDAGGIGTLVWLRNSVAPFGGTVTVVAASARFRHVAELTGLGSAFGLDLLPVASLADADSCLSGPAAVADAHENGRDRARR